jgi:pimeloyl-ACP methyl ester carboxylesterase
MPDKSFETDTGAGLISGSVAGDGPPLLMLHGGPGLSDYMHLLAPETAGWLTIRYQQRCLAPSALTGPFTVERHVADAVAVLDSLGIERAVVLGHSWGGHLALQLAVAAPERVTGLVLIDPQGAIEPDGGGAEMGQRLLTRLDDATLAQLGELAAAIGDRAPTDAEALAQLRLLWPAYFADPAQAPDPPADLALSVVANQEVAASVAESLAGGFASRLAQVTVPAAFVLGELSPMPMSQGEQTAELLPAAAILAVPDAGHLPWHEQPGCVAAALLAVREAPLA